MSSAYRFTVSGLVFTASTCLAATGLGILAGRLSPWLAMAALAAGLCIAVLAFKTISPAPLCNWTLTARLMAVVFILVSLRSFLWLVFKDGDQLKVLCRNNLGDLSLHWHYILFMAKNSSFWPENPILPGTTIRYPIGVDLFNSLLLLCGIDLLRGFVWVGLAGVLFSLCSLLRWGGAFTLAGFLFNGGIAGFALLGSGVLEDFQAQWAWKNLFLSIFVTQRGFLFCLPAGLLLMDSWRTRSQKANTSLPFWCELLLYGAMPLFHLHTFFFLSLMLGAWCVFGNKHLRKHALKLGGWALLPATALTLLVTENFRAAGGIAFQPGWMQAGTPLFTFWVGNFGLWLLLCPLLATVALRRRSATGLFVLPALTVFLLCSLFLFAPWEWDNTKLLLWSYLATLPFIWEHLLKPLAKWLQVLALLGLFFSGAVSLLGGLREPGFTIAQRSESDQLFASLQKVPADACFACAPEYNHPLVYLGRKLAMGYPGHMFGHGLPYTKVENDLFLLMQGKPEWEKAARRLKADYLFWGPREQQAYLESTKSWMGEAKVVASGAWGTLYKLPRSGPE